jgi:hypothetical protein
LDVRIRNLLLIGFLIEGLVIAAPSTSLAASSGDQQGSQGGRVGACVRPPGRLTGWWPGDGDVSDITGGRDAVLHGDATFGAGAVDGAFVLDGDGDFVDVPDDPTLDVGTGDFTVDLWVNFNDTTGEQVLAEKWVQRYGELSDGWTFTKLGDNSIGFFSEGPGVGGLGVASAPISIQVNTWIHFAARKGGDTVQIFMNGAVIASLTNPGTKVDLDSASSLKFGHRGGESDTPRAQREQFFFLNGRIDEAELVVGRALSDRKILSIYLAGAAGKCKQGEMGEQTCVEPPVGLTNWWPGDRNTKDIVGGHDGILRDNATFGRGLVGRSFLLDGDGDFVEVPDDQDVDLGAGDFTIDLWVNFNDTAGEQILVEKYVERLGPESDGWTFSKGDGNNVFIGVAGAEQRRCNFRYPRTLGSTSRLEETVPRSAPS